MDIHIRKGAEGDISAVYNLILELAQYEKAPQEVTVSPELLLKDGFGSRPLFEFLVAEVGGEIKGMAFYYFRYSTWKGKFLYLEDFVVTENLRGNGIGSLLFEKVMEVSIAEKCAGMSWQVLDWNEPALHFYRKYAANLDPEWVNGRLLCSEIERFLQTQR